MDHPDTAPGRGRRAGPGPGPGPRSWWGRGHRHRPEPVGREAGEGELFRRTSRSVRLTEAGATFQPRASDLLGRLAADLGEAGRVGRGEAGRPDDAFTTSATAIVSERIRAFSRRRPDVRIERHDGFTVDVPAARSGARPTSGSCGTPRSETASTFPR
ncbi:hypothetical protein GCM10010275_67470 [Streptomyces litmocidini]|nr:hypothetical protein GCM10010275_67470 [Streptomyces litmocidini]